MKKRWHPGNDLRPLVKLLGTDPNAIKTLREGLAMQAKAQNIPPEALRELEANINDWAISSIEIAQRRGVKDWDSPQALEAFGFDPNPVPVDTE